MLIDGLYSGALDLHSDIDAVDVGDIQTWLSYSDDSTMTVAKSLDILGNTIWCFRTQHLSMVLVECLMSKWWIQDQHHVVELFKSFKTSPSLSKSGQRFKCYRLIKLSSQKQKF